LDADRFHVLLRSLSPPEGPSRRSIIRSLAGITLGGSLGSWFSLATAGAKRKKKKTKKQCARAGQSPSKKRKHCCAGLVLDGSRVCANPTSSPPPPGCTPRCAGKVCGSDGCGGSCGTCQSPIYGYRVVATYPHDRRAFTQGLAYVDGVVYESTGLLAQSTLRRVDLVSGAVLQSVALAPQYFGEGITVLDDRLFQLTWKNGVCLVYDRETFQVQQTFSYTTEGWGLTTDGTHLIMSDGSNRLSFRDPATFEVLRSVDVFDGEQAIPNLNELELIGGEVWANVWLTDLIARIDPASGQVRSWVALTGLLPQQDRRPVDVLNGITHDPATDRLFVTGKLWPTLFQIEVVASQ
jgi:glutaminyl-peptide cyclotransferase